jgi:membrane protein implicated in regulation of membrane protease activity
MWGAAVGIIIADIVYFLTGSVAAFLLFIPGALIGYWLARRFLNKWGSVEGYIKGNK